MATTTTNYGWDIPQSTDLVKDGATAIATLGQDIDTSVYTALGGNKSGLVLLNTTSFSGVSSYSLPASTFSSTYDNYRIVFSNLSHSTGSTTYWRMRAAGTDATGADYGGNWWYFVGSSGNNFYNTATSNAPQLWDNAVAGILDIYQPNLARATTLASMGIAGPVFFPGAGQHNLLTSYDSMTFIRTSGTMSGTYSVYGYNK